MPSSRLALLTAAFAASALLAACGGDDAASSNASSTPTSTSSKQKQKAASTRPEDNLPKAKCPSKAGAKLSGPDIIGLKLGMSFDEALNHARCALDDGVIGFNNRWFQQMKTGSVTLEKQGFTIQRGETSECVFKSLGDAQKCGLGRRVWDHIDELVSVASPGIDGRQTVVGIWRYQNWKPGAMPSRDSVLAALRDKYGKEGELTDNPHGTVSWRYDTAGEPLSKANPQFNACYGITARPGGSQQWREGCGLSITADLVAPRDNPQLVQTLYVGMAHQENLLNYGEAMQAELDRLDAERRKSEVEGASGSAPKL